MGKTYDPAKIETIFNLVAAVKDNIRLGALNAAMANLVKALQLYLSTPMLKKEREVLEEDFYLLQQKIAEHPIFASVYGPVSFRRGEHRMNVDFMIQLIKFGAETLEEKVEQGLELLENDRLEEAIALFLEVLYNPDAELKTFLTIGDALLKKKKWPQAQEVFALALKRDPDSINILNRMAISYRKDKKYPEALKTYKKALLLSRWDENLYYNLARLFLDMNRPQFAAQALRKALALNPRFTRATKLLQGILESMGESESTPQADQRS